MLSQLRNAFISFAAGCIAPWDTVEFVLTPDGPFPTRRMGLQRSDELLELLHTGGIKVTTINQAAGSLASQGGPRIRPDHWLWQDTEKRFFLVMVPPGAKINPSRVAGALGSDGELSVVSDRVLRSLLSVGYDCLSVLSVINDPARLVNVIIDDRLMNEVSLILHALTTSRAAVMSPAQLAEFLELTKHSPRYLSVAMLSPSQAEG